MYSCADYPVTDGLLDVRDYEPRRHQSHRNEHRQHAQALHSHRVTLHLANTPFLASLAHVIRVHAGVFDALVMVPAQAAAHINGHGRIVAIAPATATTAM